MIAYRYPCAPCGDAHLFVVVASGATGGERIAQPEAALCGNMVSDVREGCGALVGGYHQVIAVRTVGHRMGGVHGLPSAMLSVTSSSPLMNTLYA